MSNVTVEEREVIRKEIARAQGTTPDRIWIKEAYYERHPWKPLWVLRTKYDLIRKLEE